MGSNTLHGFPYPVGTDRVMDGDDAIKALAEMCETRVVVGGVHSLTVSGLAQYASSASQNVVYPLAWPAGSLISPVAVCANGRLCIGITAGDHLGFTYNATNFYNSAASGTFNVFWVAIKR